MFVIALWVNQGVPGQNAAIDKVAMPPIAMHELKSWTRAEYAEVRGPFTAEKIVAPDFISCAPLFLR